MIDKSALKDLAEELVFHGSQKLTTTAAIELAKSILSNKIPSLVPAENSIFKERVSIQADSNKEVMTDVLAKLLPESITKEAKLEEDKYYWRRVFISSAISAGETGISAINIANAVLLHLYPEE